MVPFHKSKHIHTHGIIPHMSVQPTLPDKQDQAYPPFQLYQPVGRNTRCRNAVLPIAIPGLAECAKRLNPPPPAGDGVLRTLLKCLKKHNYASRTGPRIPPGRFALMQKKVPKITSVFCCLSGPILRAF